MIYVNLFKQRRDKKVSSLSKEIQERLKKFEDKSADEYQLQVIGSCNTKPMNGDVFVFAPVQGIYFFGRVLEADIKSKISQFYNHKNVIILFSQTTKDLNLEEYNIDYQTVLGNPMIVDDSYWKKGYFYTIGNIPITQEEKLLDYGFYKIHPRGDFFCTSSGELLDVEPQLLGLYAVATITGVAAEVNRELIMDPTLLLTTK
ncbi:immunity 26/phosphotriesterase HocA family protein [Streptococcus suis]|uniref:immunity 26/phosphotriesterase HocA family protein n=1 Tax=Streptococcus suis TaxID=1307 RepID=UPI0004142DF6|nr:immunity 26/phosphotriesterase HocA family protein [Streptococcus suis]MDG4514938.1 immunity 26/phosphotriesterase HocA family protein [Streptococcus suis]NQI88081.1 hypothetical protein [Streptococcus suis]NQI94073.1 hypothetical protein [Streptococcus suis]NQJ00624.1 hypothetical protein [Streptococcus suis]NQM31098.1 hypothetical protein [Streptococcus suis]